MSDSSAGPSLLLPIVACLTLGLAPWFPMPHLVEKLLWIVQGKSFRPVDVFDLLFHAAPWVWLGIVIVLRLRQG